jgi:hypothetical protein
MEKHQLSHDIALVFGGMQMKFTLTRIGNEQSGRMKGDPPAAENETRRTVARSKPSPEWVESHSRMF